MIRAHVRVLCVSSARVCGHGSFGVHVLENTAMWLCVVHRWVGYAEWAQRGWLRYKAYHPTASLLTIRPKTD